MSASFQSSKDNPYTCPYAGCGRNFVSAEQLKAHIDRRHKTEPKIEKDIVGSKRPEALKKTQGFDTQKR